MFQHQILGGGSSAVNSACILYLKEDFKSVEPQISYAIVKNVPRKQTQFLEEK